MESDKPLVLVTGASGYVGGWVIVKLLNSGKYRVRGTVRDTKNEEKLEPLKSALEEQCWDNYEDFEFAEAELCDFTSIKLAMEGVAYVIHIASPMAAPGEKDQEAAVIKPAVEGNLNVINACIDSTVQRVVITSSGLTICDHKKGEGVYSHDSFVEEEKSLDTYSKSKIRAEQAAIKLVEDLEEKGKRTFDLMFIHPGGISGRPLVPQFKGESIKMFAQILEGQFSRVPKVYYPMVDVQDTAQAHINAIEHGTHLGRYPLANGTHKFVDLVTIVKEKYNPMGYKVSNKELGKLVVWAGSLFNSDAKNIYFHWDIKAELDGEYSKNELNLVDYITAEDSIIDTCEFLIENKYVKEPKKKKSFFSCS